MRGYRFQSGRVGVVAGDFLSKGWMWSAVLCALLTVSSRGGSAWAESGTPKPHAVASESAFDFGTVPQGAKVVHEFSLKNEGSAPFSIQRIVPSCGCTASAADISTVPPGGAAKIRVEFDTTGFSGERTKSVRVLTSDSERPSIDLTIKGVIVADVVAEPAYLALGDIFPAAVTSKKQVTVRVREGSDTKIRGVKAWSNAITVTEDEVAPSKRVLSVGISPNLPPGDIRDRIVVTLETSSGEKMFNIPVVASVKSEVVVKPGVLSFGVIEGEKILLRKATLSNFGSRPMAVREISSSDPALSGVATPVDGGKGFVIEVSLDPKGIQSDFRGVLTIITDRQDVPPVALNVYGIVPPR